LKVKLLCELGKGADKRKNSIQRRAFLRMLAILDILWGEVSRNVNHVILNFCILSFNPFAWHCCKVFGKHIPKQNSLEAKPVVSKFGVQQCIHLVGTR
jgi:hypothetical protein